MNNTVEKEFLNECKIRMEGAYQRFYHCIELLDEKQIWWRPNDNMNSVAVLVKHICGSFRQWTITPINKTEDRRNRPQEFLNDNGLTKADIVSLMSNLKTDFMDEITNLASSRFTEPVRIQGNDLVLMNAIFRALTHLEGHIGQIVVLTRIQLGDSYKIFWIPKTEEQKSEWKLNVNSTNISLHNMKMNVIETAPNGVVNKDTIFSFVQTGNNVSAGYTGGKIEKGFLVGTIDSNQLNFSFCQLRTDGTIDNGKSFCDLSINEEGKIRLTERFEWESRNGESGVNVFQEI